MSNSYNYLDQDYTYDDTYTGILRCLLNITDTDTLIFVESSVFTKRLRALQIPYKN
jgi:cell filamentation protein